MAYAEQYLTESHTLITMVLYIEILNQRNIFLRSDKGPAVIGDFGICIFEETGTRLTITDEAVGPALFIAPELEDWTFSIYIK